MSRIHARKPTEKKMRLRILFAAGLGLSLGLGIAAALAGEPGYYVSGEGGVSLLPELRLGGTTPKDESFGTGYVAGGALGYDTGTGWRLELNSLYQHSVLSKLSGTVTAGHISSTGIMANAMYDFLPDERFTPYLGAGIGVQNVGGQIGTLTGRDWAPAYQAEAGFRQGLMGNVSLFGEYRYSQSESVTLSDASTTGHQHFEDHALLAGLTFKMN
jgi:OOP family OmpA-OmpF porin